MVSFVPADGKPIAVIPEIGGELMRRTWLDDIRTWNAPDPADDGLTLLEDLMAPYATSGARIGIMKGHETYLRMPLGDWERLVETFRQLNSATAQQLFAHCG